MPSGRTFLYAVWKACLRCGVKPPGVAGSWNECSPVVQAQMIAFSEIAEYELHGIIQASSFGL